MPGHSLVESEGELFGFVPGAAGTGYASTGTIAGGVLSCQRRPAAAADVARTQVTVERSVQSHRGPDRNGQPFTHSSFAALPIPSEETACASRI